MKMFLVKGVILSVPAILWLAIVLVIDPFDYFNVSHVISNEVKRQNAQEINELFFHVFREANAPSANLLIGDSRTANLPIDEIDKVTGQHYSLLTGNALKLNEAIDLFWLANRYRKLENVYIGINFSMFNQYAYADRVKTVDTIVANPLRYVFNRSTAQALFNVVEATITQKPVVNSVPPMSRDDFWNYMITTRASEWYAKYKFPDDVYAKMKTMVEFARANDINLVFIIVPHHVEFQNRLWDYRLTSEKVRFLEAMAALNTSVIDYDYVNEITLDKKNFLDPVHYGKAAGVLIADEVWTGQYKIGKLLNANYVQHVSAKELGHRKPDALAAFSGGVPPLKASLQK